MKKKLLQLIDLYDTEWKSILGAFVVGFVMLCIWLFFKVLPVQNRQKDLDNRKTELSSQLIDYEIQEIISQSDRGNRVVPNGLKLIYELNIEGEKYKNEEFILWSELAREEKVLLESNANFCIRVKTFDNNLSTSKAIIVKCKE